MLIRWVVFQIAVQLASTALPATPSAEASQASLTFGPRGHFLLEASINGGPARTFALDTAAGRTVVHKGRLGELGLDVEAGRRGVAQGAHGQSELGFAHVRSLTIGDLEIGALEVGVMDLSHVEGEDMTLFGVLGFDVLSRFDLLIDAANERVSFHPPTTGEESCAVCAGQIAVPFELVHGTHIELELSIDGVPLAAILDTGSGRTGMNRLGAEAIGVELPPLPAGAHALGLRVSEVRLGAQALVHDLTIGVIDLPVFEALGLSDEPAMILGTGALEGRTLGISYSLQRLSID